MDFPTNSVILMQKGLVVFVFANYLDDVLVWNYAMSGFKRGIEKVGMGSIPACNLVLNSLKFRLLPKNCPKQASCSAEKVSASWTQKSRSEDQECVALSSICKNRH
jgi:hypothetical protein